MDPFLDYYTILGIERDAQPAAIKAAFKRLALQYHPDVYKGEDAHERMRLLLQAYQTLNDPVARKKYDAVRSEHMRDGYSSRTASSQYAPSHPTTGTNRRSSAGTSSGARRDRQRYYDFPDFREGQSVHIDLIDMAYTLAPAEALTLLQQGMLRGGALENEEHAYYCHRCRHRWRDPSERGEKKAAPRFCPHCHAADWPEYLLLRCVHCCAVFESEQIRYEVGTYTYGKGRSTGGAALCPPYELFPLCPYCNTARWCPAEDARVSELRQQAAQRAARWRMMWISLAVVAVVLVGVVALGILK